jgi:hypothetical protein
VILDTKIKKIGKGDYSDGKINLPDAFSDLFKKYRIELVESEQEKFISIYFIKNDIDFFTYTIYNSHIDNNLQEGFKLAIEKLVYIESQIND